MLSKVKLLPIQNLANQKMRHQKKLKQLLHSQLITPNVIYLYVGLWSDLKLIRIRKNFK